MIKLFKLFVTCGLIITFSISIAFSAIIKDIKIYGNERISDETILMFSEIKSGDDFKDVDLNNVLKKLYETKFFKDVLVKFEKNIFIINVIEAPLIQNISISGVKAKKFKEIIRNSMQLKEKSSYNELILYNEIESIKSSLKLLGFYFAEVEVNIEVLKNNLIDIEYKVDLGEKSRISKISFIGDKIYKNKKLKSIIVSEEFKFWKLISEKKYLKRELINLDKRLLKNFYLNNGFYNIKINSSFAKQINDNEFELIFNIEPGEKIQFGDLKVVLPDDFEKSNFVDLEKLLISLKGNPYSINSVDKILNEINKITTEEEFKTVKAYTSENIIENELNIDFVIEEEEKFFVEKINIFGNNITQENVIRNRLEIDEGDPFSELLAKKSENNIKSLNFFANVKTSINNGANENSKIINIEVEEKATGEIAAGAGAGTDGGSFFFSIKENNYLGRGLGVNANATISSETFKGEISVTNPNFKNTEKSIFFKAQAIETDKLKNYGYKTNKTGFSYGTSFEYLDDFRLGLANLNFFEKIETDSTASARQQKQAGNYYDSFINLDFNLDKRNQKFKTTDGFYSFYDLTIPIISDTNTVINNYNYKMYSELFEDNISTFSFSLGVASSLSDNDIKLSERLFIPSNKLRGFEKGKVGPKDGNDFVGGNYITTLNLASNIPMFFENSQNLDALIFFDAANIWGVDYDTSINDGGKIRSSVGIGIDWLTPIGPLNFSITEVISKKDTDKEEFFRFNLGTTF